MAGSGVVLVVDDDAMIRDVVRDALEFDGYRVITAEHGVAGLAVLDDVEPCVVLLDMRMPVLDGWGFSRAYRERAVGAPLVVMTAAEHAERWRAEIGGDGCLPKPFDLDALLALVDQYCGQAGPPPAEPAPPGAPRP
jgi:two-component system chemotaxis response regulator CheY